MPAAISPCDRRIKGDGSERSTSLLSYLHGFHAGNHADVFKHAVLTLLLEALLAKPKPLVYVESHAGAGRYALGAEQALKTAEYRLGIERLWERRDAFPQLSAYLGAISALNPDGGFSAYPGSPALAAHLLRTEDRLILMELHPTESQTLRRHLGGDPRIGIHRRDGLEGLSALLPPKPARGLVLIDPPYEQVSEYVRVADALVAAHARWPTGVFALWFPRLGLQRDRSADLIGRIRRSVPDGLLCELRVRRQVDDFGMHGSGMLILNPPWRLEEQLADLLPRLAEVLAMEETGRSTPTWTLGRA
ncbi:MAG: 23S rRNA (adenine(2030)-N(6))-methyltransferase RlmJ [Thiocapsa sp.]|uniref:23S rRNA (adenine(2030)-N(6))-methyltransferase RlmJ n=1 Tax=Thiocapsa sp. TaxID=2024551 RepID=UPI001BCBD42E|nr:23S rRNA (adenine(2030)-N(6))-methyltransferase RlmJ [Thiocapsa sp.]QVL46903.1 MAG: 23S rRNA (adenine(2030)-N(6))-methyltransferase RlmJ [Thiocapsa sp.]